MKKALIVTTIVATIGAFNRPNIKMLQELGYQVDVATNFVSSGGWSEEKIQKLHDELSVTIENAINVKFSRLPLNKDNIKAYRAMKALIKNGNYDLIHCQTPVAAAITRLAAHSVKSSSYILYTCHGFNFHKTSTLKDRLIYKTVEYFLSKYTDEIITINKEDYALARSFRKNLKVNYIHGVGVDTARYQGLDENKDEYYEELGLPKGAYVILSVGELIPRKNHEVVIRALAKLSSEQLNNTYYLICGGGTLKKYLEGLIESLNLFEHVKLLGFRSDIPDLCALADISIIPSVIEGLGLAGVESLAAGTPVIGSNIQGIKDYTVGGKTGFTFYPTDVDELKEILVKSYDDKGLKERLKANCIEMAQHFDKSVSYQEQVEIYRKITEKIKDK